MEPAEPFQLKVVWELIRQTVSGWSRINAPRLGAALAFYTMWSIAPLLVLFLSIAALVFGPQAAQNQVADQMQNITGPAGGEAIQSLLAHAANAKHGAFAAEVGFLILLFGASGVFGELRDSLNLVWGIESTSNTGFMHMVRYRFFSFAMVLGVGFLLLVSLLVSAGIAAAGKLFQSYLPISEAALHLGSTLVTFATVTVLFALLYKLVPDAHIDWRDVWVGAAGTALLFAAGKLAIGLYLGRAGVGSAYGAAGSLVVFIIWVYYSAQIFFLGAVFTRIFAERRGSRAARGEPPSEPASARENPRDFRPPKAA
jgi:membrane protein